MHFSMSSIQKQLCEFWSIFPKRSTGREPTWKTAGFKCCWKCYLLSLDITTSAEVSLGHCDSCVPTNGHIPGAKLAVVFHREQAN